MSYKVENLNDCTKKLVFSFESVDLTSQIDKAIKKKQGSVNLKGFRKGKAPLHMVKQIYGAQVENEALYSFISEEFYQAIQKEEMKAVGYPTFGNTNFEKEKNKIDFEATVQVIPVVTIKDVSKYEFKKDDTKVEDAEVEQLINKYLEPKAEMKEIEDDSAIIRGHHVVFNFEGEKEDGTKPENMKGAEFVLEIGSGQFIPGFEEGLIGLKKDEKKTIDLTFPMEYHDEALKGAKVKFHVEILELKEKKFPDLTDELAVEFGFESITEMNTKTRERFENQRKNEVQQKLHQQILEKLVAENKFDIPSTLVDEQKKSIIADVSNNLKQQGFNEQMIEMYFEKWQEDVDGKAEFQVKSGLILDCLAKKYDVETSDTDLDGKLQEMADQSGMELDQVKEHYLKNENVKSNMLYAIREEKTFAKVISDMKVS